MTTGSFSLDPDTFPAVADVLDRQRERLTTSLGTVRSTVDGTGNPWGADQQGSLVGTLYAGLLKHVTEVVESHVDQLDYASTSLREWARTHRENDDQVSAVFTQLGDQA